MNANADTDTLLAIVTSLLKPDLPQQDQSAILDALVQCEGDVQSAAELLNGKGTGKMKRKRMGDLDAWLVPQASKKHQNRAETSPTRREVTPPPATRTSESTSPSSPVNLMTI